MKKLRHLIEYLLVKFWFWLVTTLKLKRATKFASILFPLIGMRLKASKTAFNNLSHVFPKLTSNEKNDIILGVWQNLGMVAAETPLIAPLPQEEFNKHVTVKGSKILDQVRGKKALFFMAHLANWEIIGRSLAPFDMRFNAVYRAANNKLVDKMINDLRKHTDATLIPKGKSGAKQIIQALHNEQPIIMLIDQKMNDGISVPFLDHNAMTAPAIATLAIKYDCPIIPLQVIRTKDSNFEIIIHPILPHKNKTPEIIMKEINDIIGKWVKSHPKQWFWLHRRWMNF